MSEQIEQDNNEELSHEEMEAKKAEIREGIKTPDSDEEVELPSDNKDEGDDKLFAGSFKSVEELKKSIANLKEDVPDYMMEGMSDEALEKYYIDLRKEFSSKKEEPKIEDKEEDKKEDKKESSDDILDTVDDLFRETGDMEAVKDKLLESGMSEKAVDKVTKAMTVEAQVFTDKVFDMAGGQDEYQAIKDWAEENYNDERLKMIGSGSYEEVLFKMEAVKADYLSKNNGQVATDRLRGGSQSSASGYKDQQEWLLDRGDKRYKIDPKYKAKVDEKFKNSPFA